MASTLEPTHGTGAFMGYLEEGPDGNLVPDDVPKKMGNSYTDFLATWIALTAVMASLIHRARTGRGMWIDLAMYQVGLSFLGEGLLDFAHNGRRTRRMGNRHRSMAPHGCYPCKGNDEWVTLAARDDSDWKALRQILSQETQELHDEKFSQPLGRLAHQDELDHIISQWTSSRGQYQVMEELQAVGVPAGPVLNARGLLADPHFRFPRLLRSCGASYEHRSRPQGIRWPRLEIFGRRFDNAENPRHYWGKTTTMCCAGCWACPTRTLSLISRMAWWAMLR